MQTAKVCDQNANPLAKQENKQPSLCLQTQQGCCWIFAALQQCFGCCRRSKRKQADTIEVKERGHSSTQTTNVTEQAKDLWIEPMNDLHVLQKPEVLSPSQILANNDSKPQVEQYSPGVTEEFDYEIVEPGQE